MLLKQLIDELTEIYLHEVKYSKVMGEPEIMIDVFKPDPFMKGYRTYAGFSPNVKIERSSDGIYYILSQFKGE